MTSYEQANVCLTKLELLDLIALRDWLKDIQPGPWCRDDVERNRVRYLAVVERLLVIQTKGHE